MALSVLPLTSDGKACGLYDSTKERFILKGTRKELYAWKDRIERREQHKDNADYRESLRQEWIDLLIKSGNTEEEANNFLKTQMPYLYEDQTA